MVEKLETLAQLLSHAGFVGGLIGGVILLGILSTLSWMMRGSVPGWALAVATVVVAVIALYFQIDRTLIFALAALALGGWLLDRSTRSGGAARIYFQPFVWVLLTLAAIWLSSTKGFVDVIWIRFLAPIAVIGIGAGLRRMRESPIAPLVGVLFAISTFGIWATVPETDMVSVLLGASLPLALATTPFVGARITGLGAFALAGVVVWLVVDGGTSRPGSVIGGLATIGVIALLPIAGLHRAGLNRVLVIGLHILVVFAASRFIGAWSSAAQATAGVIVLWSLTILVLRVTAPRPEREVEPSPQSPMRNR